MRKAHVIHELRLHGMARGNTQKPIATLRQMLKLARSRTRNPAEEPSTATISHANAGNAADNAANKLDATVAAPHVAGAPGKSARAPSFKDGQKVDIDFNGKEYKAHAYVASCGKQVLVVYQVDGSEERMAWEEFEDRCRGSHDAFHPRKSGRRTSPCSFIRAQRDFDALTMRAAMDDDDDEREAYDSDGTDCTEIEGFAVFSKRSL